MKLFISYSHADKPIVDRIVARLKQVGHDIWTDTLKIQLGDNVQAKIDAGLNELDATAVLAWHIKMEPLGSPAAERPELCCVGRVSMGCASFCQMRWSSGGWIGAAGTGRECGSGWGAGSFDGPASA